LFPPPAAVDQSETTNNKTPLFSFFLCCCFPESESAKSSGSWSRHRMVASPLWLPTVGSQRLGRDILNFWAISRAPVLNSPGGPRGPQPSTLSHRDHFHSGWLETVDDPMALPLRWRHFALCPPVAICWSWERCAVDAGIGRWAMGIAAHIKNLLNAKPTRISGALPVFCMTV
jgi:hypothetical protein